MAWHPSPPHWYVLRAALGGLLFLRRWWQRYFQALDAQVIHLRNAPHHALHLDVLTDRRDMLQCCQDQPRYRDVIVFREAELIPLIEFGNRHIPGTLRRPSAVVCTTAAI